MKIEVFNLQNKNNDTYTIENGMMLAQDFIDWKNKLHSEMRGGKLMFDVPKHYKWIDESELFTYYMDSGH